MLHDISHDATTESGPVVAASREQLARQEATKQIGRRRRF
jgi:hypothetical protein